MQPNPETFVPALVLGIMAGVLYLVLAFRSKQRKFRESVLRIDRGYKSLQARPSFTLATERIQPADGLAPTLAGFEDTCRGLGFPFVGLVNETAPSGSGQYLVYWNPRERFFVSRAYGSVNAKVSFRQLLGQTQGETIITGSDAKQSFDLPEYIHVLSHFSKDLPDPEAVSSFAQLVAQRGDAFVDHATLQGFIALKSRMWDHIHQFRSKSGYVLSFEALQRMNSNKTEAELRMIHQEILRINGKASGRS